MNVVEARDQRVSLHSCVQGESQDTFKQLRVLEVFLLRSHSTPWLISRLRYVSSPLPKGSQIPCCLSAYLSKISLSLFITFWNQVSVKMQYRYFLCFLPPRAPIPKQLAQSLAFEWSIQAFYPCLQYFWTPNICSAYLSPLCQSLSEPSRLEDVMQCASELGSQCPRFCMLEQVQLM